MSWCTEWFTARAIWTGSMFELSESLITRDVTLGRLHFASLPQFGHQ